MLAEKMLEMAGIMLPLGGCQRRSEISGLVFKVYHPICIGFNEYLTLVRVGVKNY